MLIRLTSVSSVVIIMFLPYLSNEILLIYKWSHQTIYIYTLIKKDKILWTSLSHTCSAKQILTKWLGICIYLVWTHNNLSYGLTLKYKMIVTLFIRFPAFILSLAIWIELSVTFETELLSNQAIDHVVYQQQGKCITVDITLLYRRMKLLACQFKSYSVINGVIYKWSGVYVLVLTIKQLFVISFIYKKIVFFWDLLTLWLALWCFCHAMRFVMSGLDMSSECLGRIAIITLN